MDIPGRYRLLSPATLVLCLLVGSVSVALLPNLPVYADSSSHGNNGNNNGCQLNFLYGQPVVVGSDLLSALVTQGRPIM